MKCTSLGTTLRRVAYLTFSTSVFAVYAHAQTVSESSITSSTTLKRGSEMVSETVSETTTLKSVKSPVMTMDQMITWQRQQAASKSLPLVLKSSGPVVLEATREDLAKILPLGLNSYTYYEESNIYYRERTKTFFYAQNGEWKYGSTPPRGTHLGVGRTVYLTGQSTTAGPSDNPVKFPR